MKRNITMTRMGLALALAFSAPLMATEVATTDEARLELARDLAAVVGQPAFDAAVRDHLGNGRASLADVLRDYQHDAPADGKAGIVDDMLDLDRQAIRLRGLDGAVESLASVRVHGLGKRAQPKTVQGFLTAAVTRDPSSGKKTVVTFDAQGTTRSYDIQDVPDVPMLVVETDGAAAMQAGMAVINEAMRRKGLQQQPASPMAARSARSSADGELLTMLKQIYLENDHEPNIQGDAEIFAIVSGVDAAGKVHVVTKDMPWLDHDKRWYTPNQDLINWTEFGTNYVNVQFFEDDGNTNFQKLAVALTGAVGDVALVVAPAAPPAMIVAGVAKVGEKILGAMESSWFTNDADYVDSFYVIERGGNYGSKAAPLIGARGEAKMVLAPYEVKGR